ncbi:MAG TPA: restriction endonuclease subunit S [Defluviitaleaceae bacterium]|nr:restriction endonuclease subunit S [Defluviitaleaceae bacterium]
MAVISVAKLSELEGAKRLDAEYYRPEYSYLLANLYRTGALPVKIVAVPVKRKFRPLEGEYFDYIEIAEVDLSTGEFNASKIIGEEAPNRAQWVVKRDDILISTVRPIRNAVVWVRDEKENLVCSSGFAVIHPTSVSSEYLFIYFKTEYIAKLLDRYTTATEYPAVTWKDILNIPVFLGNKELRSEITEDVNKAFTLLEESQISFSQAEDLLLEELRLKNFKPKYELSYVTKLSQAFNAHRIDAEYFQPVYDKLLKYLVNNFETIPLKRLIFGFQKGIEVGSENYEEDGIPFIRVSNLSVHGFVKKDQKYIDEDLYKTLKETYEPKVGDLLLTKDATPGIAFIVKEPVEGIIASGILKLKLDEEKIDKEYLALFINSIVGKLQIERDSGGSVIAHCRPEQIKHLLVPLLPIETQQQIASLVQQSHEARRRAKELLEEAKRRVEEAIESEIKQPSY